MMRFTDPDCAAAEIPAAKVDAQKHAELRDRFAMAALTGLLAGNTAGLQFKFVAQQAWTVAEQMLEWRDSSQVRKPKRRGSPK